MKLLKPSEYAQEIGRIKHIIATTKNYKCKQDHIKCLKRLEREYNEYAYWMIKRN